MKEKFKKNILAIGIAALCFTSIALSFFGFGKGDIPNGKYVFHGITVGNIYIDKSDTLKTIKEKLLSEFPDYGLESPWPHGADKTWLDVISENLFGLTETTNFFEVKGNRMDFRRSYSDSYPSANTRTSRNEKYRLASSGEIETRGFHIINSWGFQWHGMVYFYYSDGIIYQHHSNTWLPVTYRSNFKRS